MKTNASNKFLYNHEDYIAKVLKTEQIVDGFRPTPSQQKKLIKKNEIGSYYQQMKFETRYRESGDMDNATFKFNTNINNVSTVDGNTGLNYELIDIQRITIGSFRIPNALINNGISDTTYFANHLKTIDLTINELKSQSIASVNGKTHHFTFNVHPEELYLLLEPINPIFNLSIISTLNTLTFSFKFMGLPLPLLPDHFTCNIEATNPVKVTTNHLHGLSLNSAIIFNKYQGSQIDDKMNNLWGHRVIPIDQFSFELPNISLLGDPVGTKSSSFYVLERLIDIPVTFTLLINKITNSISPVSIQ